MAISPTWKKGLLGSVSAGAIAVAGMLITGPNGNDGLEGRIHKPYKDVVGVVTVCDGHAGKDIIWGKYYSDAECDALLKKDLTIVASQVDPLIKRPLPVATTGAIYSFVYNVGVGNFKSSTMLRKINAGNKFGACDELKKWVYAGGQKWKGLINRREIEREVCLWQ